MKNVAVVPVRDARPHRPEPAAGDGPTRERLVSLLLDLGSATVAVLAERLGLTAAGVRRHLDALLADGAVEAREPRPLPGRGRGRPAKVFRLTERGRAALPQAYDDLAASALRFLAESGGPAAVEAFARTRVAELERRYAPVVAAAPVARRTEALAAALTADGYAATASPLDPAGPGAQLCQHHCPVAHVAEQFPALCEAETEVIGRLLGTHVQRLATIAHGDGVCTTHVPAATPLRRKATL